MNISDIEITASGNLERTDGNKLQIGEIDIDVEPGTMDLSFENLSVLGSETIGETIVSTMSGLVYSAVKSTVLEKTSDKIRHRINQRLASISLNVIANNSQSLLDDLIAFAVDKIKDRLEPLKLPPFQKQASRKTSLFTLSTAINVTGGHLYGLSTFARTGDIFVTYHEDTAIIQAEMGFHNLTGAYKWDVKFMGKCCQASGEF